MVGLEIAIYLCRNISSNGFCARRGGKKKRCSGALAPAYKYNNKFVTTTTTALHLNTIIPKASLYPRSSILETQQAASTATTTMDVDDDDDAGS